MIAQATSVTPGLDIDALCQLIPQSQCVVFHAALYSNFARSKVEQSLHFALASNPKIQVYLIEQAFELTNPWHGEFGRILREQICVDEMHDLFLQSHIWCQLLLQKYPNQVHHLVSNLLPCQPILLIDNHVFTGQYAHCEIAAPQGVWLHIDGGLLGINVAMFRDWLQQGIGVKRLAEQIKPPLAQQRTSELTSAQIAVYRYVAECGHAIENATKF
ncbi:hypothetical protein HWQ46_20355 [Shewanella sp. D64]|uniref:hypothetical protein n=1 Tax=unclassified Shewanella TaxID=196818 RepID=UPI0022BA4348|nr:MULTISPECIES: hypothetical protein [unclassified Shewanella]MEC4727890.1 hypothetical protein [Shewanella sp. D64]MEC4739932.1 hypothetical protein [Shewanella sp. E94]WBJ97106.1 hypothetical protein HWQ47_08355 [Shewanella sp. MTB7]